MPWSRAAIPDDRRRPLFPRQVERTRLDFVFCREIEERRERRDWAHFAGRNELSDVEHAECRETGFVGVPHIDVGHTEFVVPRSMPIR